MTTGPTEAVVQDAVSSLAAMLAADGYGLTVVATVPEVELRIDAVGDACADCLVPEQMMRQMVAAALASTPVAGRPIRVHYPAQRVE